MGGAFGGTCKFTEADTQDNDDAWSVMETADDVLNTDKLCNSGECE